MSIEKIKMTMNELITILEKLCISNGISIYVENKTPLHIRLIKDKQKGLLRIYEKKDGLKIDSNVPGYIELNIEVEELFKSSQVIEKTVSDDYTYKNITDEQFANILIELDEFCNDEIELNVKENKDPNKVYFGELINTRTKEAIKISKYKNGSLQIQGVVWILWEDLCQIIETNINVSISDLVDRFLLGNSDNINKLTDFSDEELEIKNKVTENVFNFLDEHYRDYLISAQCIIGNNVKMKEYSTVLCPTAKALEGYTKKLLIDLDLEKAKNMKKNWSFTKVFSVKKQVSNMVLHCLPDDLLTKITEDQHQALIDLYDLVKVFRHDMNHGSPNPKLIVRDLKTCIYHYEIILEEIKNSYYNIYK